MKDRRARAAFATLTLTGLALSACGSADDGTAGDGPTVVASFYPLAFVARQVAGDSAAIVNLTEPGVEPHDLELTGRQVGEISEADLVVYLEGFQPAVDSAVEQNAQDTALETAGLADLLEDTHDDAHDDEAHEDEADDEHGHEGDPHIWLDPANMEAIADAVAERLAEIAPDNADTYRKNAENLISELRSVDEEYAAGLASCERDVFVVAHEAFGYLADRYGLEQVGIAGLDPQAEPSPQRMAQVQDIVTSDGVTTIFYERLVSPTVAETLAADLGIEAAVLDPIEGLTDDTAEQDYLSLMRANLAALRAANGCD